METRLAVNGRFLSRPITGVERYAREISTRLGEDARVIAPSRASEGIRGHLWEQFILPRRLQRGELLWSPANAGPWNIARQAITIHDAAVFDHPEWFNASYAAWTRVSQRLLVRRVQAIITVSEFSKERLTRHLAFAREKIRVVPNGVGQDFSRRTTAEINCVREKYGLKSGYFLFVGSIQPRKNIELLQRAWHASGADSHQLLICGGSNRVFAGNSSRSAYIPDEDLPAIYSGATAFVTASQYEGSCLPALEAMACGTPVIAPNSTVFPELLGDCGLLFKPNDAQSLGYALRQICENASLEKDLCARGLARAQALSWDRAARAHVDLFDSL